MTTITQIADASKTLYHGLHIAGRVLEPKWAKAALNIAAWVPVARRLIVCPYEIIKEKPQKHGLVSRQTYEPEDLLVYGIKCSWNLYKIAGALATVGAAIGLTSRSYVSSMGKWSQLAGWISVGTASYTLFFDEKKDLSEKLTNVVYQLSRRLPNQFAWHVVGVGIPTVGRIHAWFNG